MTWLSVQRKRATLLRKYTNCLPKLSHEQMKFAICFLLSLLLVHVVAAGEQNNTLFEPLQTKLANHKEPAIKGIEGWYFLRQELEHLGAGKFWGEFAAQVSHSTKPEYADPIPAILDFNQNLSDLGIELLLVPIPAKAAVYPDKTGLSYGREDGPKLHAAHVEFYQILAEQGVAVLDTFTELFAGRATGTTFCQTDTHYSGHGLRIVAQALADKIQQMAWYKPEQQKRFKEELRELTITGDLALMADQAEVSETLPLHFIYQPGSENLPIAKDPTSPILLLGDSHTLVFSVGGELHTKGAGLAENLAYLLNMPIDVMGMRGSGVTPARIKLFQKSRKNPPYIKEKKLIIWVFSVREFTGQGGWRKIPVLP
jgi:alginate O-acetyltransferase complex protein AlgJ